MNYLPTYIQNWFKSSHKTEDKAISEKNLKKINNKKNNYKTMDEQNLEFVTDQDLDSLGKIDFVNTNLKIKCLQKFDCVPDVLIPHISNYFVDDYVVLGEHSKGIFQKTSNRFLKELYELSYSEYYTIINVNGTHKLLKIFKLKFLNLNNKNFTVVYFYNKLWGLSGNIEDGVDYVDMRYSPIFGSSSREIVLEKTNMFIQDIITRFPM